MKGQYIIDIKKKANTLLDKGKRERIISYLYMKR
jgi:hypothetical protein